MLKAVLVQGLLVANIVFANEVKKTHFCFFTLIGMWSFAPDKDDTSVA